MRVLGGAALGQGGPCLAAEAVQSNQVGAYAAVIPRYLLLSNHIPAATPDANPHANKPIVGAKETLSQTSTESAAAMIRNKIERPRKRLLELNGIPSYDIAFSNKVTPALTSRRPTIGASAATE